VSERPSGGRRPAARHRRRAAILVACACLPGTVLAQRPQELPRVSVDASAPPQPPRRRPAQQPAPTRCRGETISEIVVRPQPPFLTGVLRRWQFVTRAINDLHVVTRPEVVRRFVLLGEGDQCTEFRRAESERFLRAQPFLASADVRPEPDGPGRVRLVVETVDEVSLLAGASASTSSPNVRMLRLGEDNLLGEAVHVSGEWRAGRFGRDGFTARVMDYQLLGRPYHLDVQTRRDPLGSFWQTSLAHPYFTDLQRVAWRVTGGGAHDILQLRQPGADELAIGTQRSFVDVGGILRVGVPGRLSLFGISVTEEQERADPVLRRLTAEGPVVVGDTSDLLARYRPARVARLNALWGVRGISFLPVYAFDGLTAVQDARVGLQASALIGRSMALFGSHDDDIFVSADLYAGGGTPNSFVMLRARAEGRQDFDTDRWDGVIGSARADWYTHLAGGHTMVTSAEWSGGYRTRVPFQLLLGQRDGGVRGYGRSPVGGGSRAVLRVENRWHLGRVQESADVGVAGFVDAGRMWAGNVPFGQDTPVKIGAGVSLLAALPPGSQRLWRVDVAYPLSSDPRAKLELRLSSTNVSLFGWREPRDVERGRERNAPQGLFNWP
jgi:hypothetical protein